MAGAEPEVVGTPFRVSDRRGTGASEEAHDVRPRPYGGWAVMKPYEPESVSEDLKVRTDAYVERFRVPDKAGVEFRGTFVVPQQTGRGKFRLKPVQIGSREALRQFVSSRQGKMKWALESSGDPFNLDDNVAPSLSPTRLIDQNDFIPFLGGPYQKQLYTHDYLLMHARAFQLVNHSPLAAAAVKIMTRFVVGRGLSFHVKNDHARKVWDEFWVRNKMREKQRLMARDLAWQGELMLRYYERSPGYLTFRIFDPSACWEVVTDPEDIEHVYFFHMQYPCLDGATRISCLDGTEPTIADLAARVLSDENPVWVYSYDTEAGRVAPGKAIRCWEVGEKDCVEVELDNGEKVVASYDHPFLRRDGTYSWARDLVPGDSLMPLYRRRGYEEVWQPDGRWEPTHHVVAAASAGRHRRLGEVVHHENENRADNRPDNLSFMPKSIHDAETPTRRWAKPEFTGQRERRLAALSRGVSEHWARGTYDHLKGDGARADRVEWRASIAAGVKRSWADPVIRARRGAAISAAKRNHKVVAVRSVGPRVVYDLTVERYHNFALSAGVFTHNSPYQMYANTNVPIQQYVVQQVPPTNIQHVKINASAQEKRGRSDFISVLSWLKRFVDFYDGQTVRSLLEANLVWKLKVSGDDADLSRIAADVNLTTMPPPGGVWVENDALNLEPVNAQFTGARGSSGIGEQLAAIIATSMNLPVEYFNISGTGPSRATALVRTDPAVKAIEDRQQIHKETNEEIYERVVESALREGRIRPQDVRGDPEAVPGHEEPVRARLA